MTKKVQGKYKEIKVGIINVRGIVGKEVELGKEMGKFNLSIVGISETKKRISGECALNNPFSMIYSGVTMGHEQAGVALAYNKSMADRLIKWEPVNKRILCAVFRFEGFDLKVVSVYGPVEALLWKKQIASLRSWTG